VEIAYNNYKAIPYYLVFIRVLGCFGKLWKIDNVIFQDLDSFGKGGFSKWLWKRFGFFFGKILNYPKMDVT